MISMGEMTEQEALRSAVTSHHMSEIYEDLDYWTDFTKVEIYSLYLQLQCDGSQITADIIHEIGVMPHESSFKAKWTAAILSRFGNESFSSRVIAVRDNYRDACAITYQIDSSIDEYRA